MRRQRNGVFRDPVLWAIVYLINVGRLKLYLLCNIRQEDSQEGLVSSRIFSQHMLPYAHLRSSDILEKTEDGTRLTGESFGLLPSVIHHTPNDAEIHRSL